MRVIIEAKSPKQVRCNKIVSLAAENRYNNSQRLLARNQNKAVGTQYQLRRTRAYVSCTFTNMVDTTAYDGDSKVKGPSGCGTELRNTHQVSERKYRCKPRLS